jgi:hypothetical protein
MNSEQRAQRIANTQRQGGIKFGPEAASLLFILRLHNNPFTQVGESLVSDKKSSLSGRRHEPSLTLHHHALPGYIMPLE